MAFETFNLAQVYDNVDRSASSQLRNLLLQQQMNQQQQDINKRNQVGAAFKAALRGDGTIDRQLLMSGVGQADPSMLLDLQDKFTGQDYAANNDRRAEGRFGLEQQRFAADQEAMNLPKYEIVDLGGTKQVVDVNPRSNRQLSGLNFNKTPTIGEQESMRHNRVSESQQRQDSVKPFFQALPTENGYARFNARTGQLELLSGANGGSVLPAAQSPSLQGQLSQAKESGKITGKAETEAQIGLPQYVAEAENTVKLVDDLLQSPGFKQAVGTSRLFGVQNIPGTSAKDFDVRLDQLKGKQFLQAFESLKGGGQITEVEGKKATDAISRMNAASSEKEFTAAAKEFQDVIKAGVERAKAKAGATSTQKPSNTTGPRRYNPATGRIE